MHVSETGDDFVEPPVQNDGSKQAGQAPACYRCPEVPTEVHGPAWAHPNQKQIVDLDNDTLAPSSVFHLLFYNPLNSPL